MNTLISANSHDIVSSHFNSKISNLILFNLATHKSDLEQAFRLISHCYLEKGYITEFDSKLTIKLHHALPQSAIFVGKLGDRVVTTSSIFPDSEIGLPADSIFKAELDDLRSQGRQISELGSLASNLEAGTSPLQVPLHILQSLRLGYLYSRDYLNVDDLIITVNPKHQFFYEKILMFEVISDVKLYPQVNQAPAIAMRQNFQTIESRLLAVSDQKGRFKGFRDTFFSKNIVDLDIHSSDFSVNVWNSELLNYFFCEKTNIFHNTSPDIVRKIQLKHHQNFRRDT
jgi:hypothetical protein